MFDQFGRLCDDFRDIGYASAGVTVPYVHDVKSAQSYAEVFIKGLDKEEEKTMGYDCSSYSFGEVCAELLGLGAVSAPSIAYTPKRILRSGPATIVFWQDGTKTIVKLSDGEEDNAYAAFTAALAIKIFGSNSKLKKIVKTLTEEQK